MCTLLAVLAMWHLVQHVNVYSVGCPCHVALSAACKGEDSFSGALDLMLRI